MDLDTYRELFRRQEILPAANVYGSMEYQSTNYDAYSADHNDDNDEDEGDYIRHFHDENSTAPSAPPTSRPQRNLLSDLEDLNGESSIKHDLVSEVVKNHPDQDESDGCYTVTEALGSPEIDGVSEITDQMGYEDHMLEESVEQLYNNDTEAIEQHRVVDQASSYDGDKAYGINGTKETPDYAHVPATSQDSSDSDTLAQRLRELHHQDMARDELLIVSTSLR